MIHNKSFRKAAFLTLLITAGQSIYGDEYSVFSDCGERCEVMTKQLIKFAKNGSPQAQTILAMAYRTGTLVKQDDKKAWRWIRRAKRQNYSPALYKISTWYRYGYSTEVNISKADGYLERAAESSFAPALLALGKQHYTKNNIEKAEELFKKSAKYGNSNAKRLIEKITLNKKSPLISKRGLFEDKKLSDNIVTSVAIRQDPVDLLDNILQNINDSGFYNRKGRTGSRLRGKRCGSFGSACQVISRDLLSLSGVARLSDIFNSS